MGKVIEDRSEFKAKFPYPTQGQVEECDESELGLLCFGDSLYGPSNLMLIRCARKGFVVLATEKRHPWSEITYATVVNGLCEIGETGVALKQLKKMDDNKRIKPFVGCFKEEKWMRP
ncbi:hypothetical protein TorRG33x02_114470 [Trema orientale]|uniref:Pentatricopeptide repeat n=1 Tax=Trema orientale TaxID=63057 RepID=A0A2P5F532_TREOI|nr:hypothetical protein TorRG33x02_114470 [Trema orientale]